MDIIYPGIFVMLSILTALVTSQSSTDVYALITHLFTTGNYSKKIRPLIDQKRAINISVDFVLNAIIGFDEQEESLKTAGYLVLTWTDENLVWDPASHHDIADLFLPQEDIWKPDISLRNTFKTFTGLGSSYLNVIVNKDGLVEWLPFQVLESTCSVDITYFPFDVQTCELKFTAWSYSANEVTIKIGQVGTKLEDYVESSAWSVTENSARYGHDGEVAVFFTLKLKRKPRFYIINVILPVILLSILSVFTFILPISSGEKASYAVTVFLSLSVFLTIITSELPKNSENTSLLAVYIMIVSSWSTLIVMLCLVESRIYIRDEKVTRINAGFLTFVKIWNFFTCKKCTKSVKSELCSNSSLDRHSEDTINTTVTWQNVVDGMDFVFFWISFIFTFVCTLSIGASATY